MVTLADNDDIDIFIISVCVGFIKKRKQNMKLRRRLEIQSTINKINLIFNIRLKKIVIKLLNSNYEIE